VSPAGEPLVHAFAERALREVPRVIRTAFFVGRAGGRKAHDSQGNAASTGLVRSDHISRVVRIGCQAFSSVLLDIGR